MSERTYPVEITNRALLRLHFGVSQELSETLSLLVEPHFRERFGRESLRAVAREEWMDVGERGDQFTPEQELAYAEYMRDIRPLMSPRQFSLYSLAKFGKDKKNNHYVQIFPTLTVFERQKLVQPPFYNVSERGLVHAIVRIPYEILLAPDLLGKAEAEIEDRFGIDQEDGSVTNKVANRLLRISDLRISRGLSVPALTVKSSQKRFSKTRYSLQK